MKKLLLCPAAYAVGLILLAGLLLLSFLIPSELLYDNARKSAEYIEQNEASFYDIERSAPLAYQRIDNYADMILFNIAVTADSSRPLASMLEARYLLDPYRSSAELVLARLDGEAPNADYSRYWHGMLIFIRPLLCVTDYNAMRLLNTAVLSGLVVWLCVLLVRRRLWWLCMITVFALAVCDFATVPVCFEFYIMCAMSLLFACLALIIDKRFAHKSRSGSFIDGEIHLLVFFTLAGLCTCFFDFLTAETLTLLLPLLMVLISRAAEFGEDGSYGIKAGHALRLIVFCAALWGFSYAFTYIAKWVLAAAVSPDISFTDALTYAEVRTGGEVEKAVYPLPYEAFLRNLAMLPILSMPDTDRGILAVIGIFLICALIYMILICRRPRSLAVPGLIALLALVPYLRYIVLANHSVLHHFFTYRAQAASVIACFSALVLALDKDIVGTLLGEKKERIRHNKKEKRK
nr:hypothetical protein [Clostridia bacterium]